jgi:hypothetical protein
VAGVEEGVYCGLSMPEISDAATVVMAPDVLSSELGSEYVLLNLQDGTYYGLDEVGADIWTRLQTPVTIADICDAIVTEYDVDAERCRRDVLKLLHDLAKRGLVEIRDGV